MNGSARVVLSQGIGQFAQGMGPSVLRPERHPPFWGYMPKLGPPCLLVIDVQKGFHDPVWGRRNNPKVEETIASSLEGWRSRNWPVVHVQHRSTDPKSPLHPSRPGVAFMAEAMPANGESVVEKSVNSAFIGTDLERMLRLRGLRELVLVGMTSDHCVSTSARMAANLGFGVTILADATATFDRTGSDGCHYPAELVHRISLASLHGEFARITDLRPYLGVQQE